MTRARILPRPIFDNLGQAIEWEIKHDQVPYELPISLPEAVWRDLPDALSELAHAVCLARNVLDHLNEYVAMAPNTDPGLQATLELAARGLDHASEHEGGLINDTEIVLRRVVSKMINEKLEKGKEAS